MGCLNRLRVRSFRNIREADVACDCRVTVFQGENAQGKTNFLEAVHVVTNLQSFRTRSPENLVEHGSEAAFLDAEVSDGWGVSRLAVELRGGGRRAAVDGKIPESASAYLQVCPTVFFGPADLEIARGNQELRRRYADRATFLSDPSHLERLKRYGRALKQRNAALRTPGSDLSPWNEELARLGWEVQKARRTALEGIGPLISGIHREVSGGREEPEIRFLGAATEAGWESLLAALEAGEGEDRRRGYTLRGPHRDRMSVRLGGRELREHASQGQQRTFALSLKLALLSWVKEKAERDPAFLLDDPGSELDEARLGYLGAFLSDWEGQVFIAGVGPDDVPLKKGTGRRLYRVVAGTLA